MQAKRRSLSDSLKFLMVLPGLATYLLEVGTGVSLKVAIEGSIRGRKTLKIWIFREFFYSKTGGVQPKSLNNFLSI